VIIVVIVIVHRRLGVRMKHGVAVGSVEGLRSASLS
jgi:hypothetical protein